MRDMLDTTALTTTALSLCQCTIMALGLLDTNSRQRENYRSTIKTMVDDSAPLYDTSGVLVSLLRPFPAGVPAGWVPDSRSPFGMNIQGTLKVVGFPGFGGKGLKQDMSKGAAV